MCDDSALDLTSSRLASAMVITTAFLQIEFFLRKRKENLKSSKLFRIGMEKEINRRMNCHYTFDSSRQGPTAKKSQNSIPKWMLGRGYRLTKNEKLLRDCQIGLMDKEFDPPSDAFKRLSISIHANERVKLRKVEIDWILKSLNTPRLNRCFHSVSTIFTHQYKKEGSIRIEGNRIALIINNEEVTETEMSLQSLMRHLKFPGDRKLVENANDGTEFPVNFEITGKGWIRAIMIQEDDETKMDLKKETLSNKKIITPTRVVLVVTSDFRRVITVIRPRFIENSPNCKISVEIDLLQPEFCKFNQGKSRERPSWKKEKHLSFDDDER